MSKKLITTFLLAIFCHTSFGSGCLSEKFYKRLGLETQEVVDGIVKAKTNVDDSIGESKAYFDQNGGICVLEESFTKTWNTLHESVTRELNTLNSNTLESLKLIPDVIVDIKLAKEQFKELTQEKKKSSMNNLSGVKQSKDKLKDGSRSTQYMLYMDFSKVLEIVNNASADSVPLDDNPDDRANYWVDRSRLDARYKLNEAAKVKDDLEKIEGVTLDNVLLDVESKINSYKLEEFRIVLDILGEISNEQMEILKSKSKEKGEKIKEGVKSGHAKPKDNSDSNDKNQKPGGSSSSSDGKKPDGQKPEQGEEGMVKGEEKPQQPRLLETADEGKASQSSESEQKTEEEKKKDIKEIKELNDEQKAAKEQIEKIKAVEKKCREQEIKLEREQIISEITANLNAEAPNLKDLYPFIENSKFTSKSSELSAYESNLAAAVSKKLESKKKLVQIFEKLIEALNLNNRMLSEEHEAAEDETKTLDLDGYDSVLDNLEAYLNGLKSPSSRLLVENSGVQSSGELGFDDLLIRSKAVNKGLREEFEKTQTELENSEEACVLEAEKYIDQWVTLSKNETDKQARKDKLASDLKDYETADTHYKEQLEASKNKVNDQNATDEEKLANVRTYRQLKQLESLLKKAKEHLDALGVKIESHEDIDKIAELLKVDAKRAGLIDKTDSKFMNISIEEIEIEIDAFGEDDQDLEEDLALIQTIEYYMENIGDFQEYILNEERRDLAISTLSEIFAGSLTASVAGNANENFEVDAKGNPVVIKMTPENAKKLIDNYIGVVFINCISFNLYKTLAETEENVKFDKSFSSDVKMCSNLSDMFVCLSDIDQCPEETMQQILKAQGLFKPPLRNKRKVSEVKEKGVNNIKQKTEKLKNQKTTEIDDVNEGLEKLMPKNEGKIGGKDGNTKFRPGDDQLKEMLEEELRDDEKAVEDDFGKPKGEDGKEPKSGEKPDEKPEGPKGDSDQKPDGPKGDSDQKPNGPPNNKPKRILQSSDDEPETGYSMDSNGLDLVKISSESGLDTSNIEDKLSGLVDLGTLAATGDAELSTGKDADKSIQILQVLVLGFISFLGLM